ncbi:MAG: benzoate/H(+) symporter BenE family transporter [Gaiellales bacterium]
MRVIRDTTIPAIVAGFVAVLVGFTSSAVIVFAAAQAAGATPAQAGSWMWALGLGMGATCIGLSLWFRVPILTAWSTPGAALLITSVAGVPLAETIGAFVVTGILITVAGVTGAFAWAMSRVRVSLASALLAGVLVRFGLDAARAAGTELALVLAMFAAYLVTRRLAPRYAALATLAVGVAVAAASGLLGDLELPRGLTRPEWVTPQLSLSAIVGVAVPLFAVTMASQNVPGVAVLRASGYDPPVSPVIATTGIATTILAPFGGFTFNLAAITAAICTGEDAHPDRERRYTAAVWAGVFYVLVGLFGGAVAGFFAAFPPELVVTIAGLALLGTIGNGLATALADEAEREPALVTFLVTASGVTLLSVGSAFWGLAAGVVATAVAHAGRPAAAP